MCTRHATREVDERAYPPPMQAVSQTDAAVAAGSARLRLAHLGLAFPALRVRGSCARRDAAPVCTPCSHDPVVVAVAVLISRKGQGETTIIIDTSSLFPRGDVALDSAKSPLISLM